MSRLELTINHAAGLHARPAALFVQTANKFSSDIFVSYSGRRVNAKSILGVLTLGANQGAVITVEINGIDSQEAIAALEDLVANNFQV